MGEAMGAGGRPPRLICAGSQNFAYFAHNFARSAKLLSTLEPVRPDDLADLIAGGESFTVEFKSTANDTDLVEAVTCLANGRGGRVLVGVKDDGTIIGAPHRHGDSTDAAEFSR